MAALLPKTLDDVLEKMNIYAIDDKEEIEKDKPVDMAQVGALEMVYNELIINATKSLGNKTSADARKADPIKYAGSNFVYGEIAYSPFGITLQKIHNHYGGLPAPGTGKFYDLGSGTGKPVFAANLLYDWKSCVGIEYVSELYTVSLELLERWRKEVVVKYEAELAAHPFKLTSDIKFINGDIGDFTFEDADFIFANSTCFDYSLMNKIAEQVATAKLGCYLVTFTKKLGSDLWDTLESHTYSMSWGPATVYIQKKARMAELPPPPAPDPLSA